MSLHKAAAKRWVSFFKKNGAIAKVVVARDTLTRGWEGGYFLSLLVTMPEREWLDQLVQSEEEQINIILHYAKGESSGNVTLGSSVIAMGRDRTLEVAERILQSETAHYLRLREKEKRVKAAKPKKSVVRQVATMSGYAWCYSGDPKRVLTGKDDDWEICLIDSCVGKLIGERRIDGVKHIVVKCDGNKYYAQTAASVKELSP